MLDATYNTNKFGMPLLDGIAIDGLGQGFTPFFGLMDCEEQIDYEWQVSHICKLFNKQVFPSVIATDCDQALINAVSLNFPTIRTKTVLCYWHISKNVLKNCKVHFEDEHRWEEFIKGFKDCVYAKTEEEFEDCIAEWKLEFNWNDGVPHTMEGASLAEADALGILDEERKALAYCLGSWLGTFKKQVVHAWIDQFFNGGIKTTSRLEGAHKVLKCWIGSPSKDLIKVWDATKLALSAQINEIVKHRADEVAGRQAGCQSSFYQALHGYITPHAMLKLQIQYKYFIREEQHLQEGRIFSICTGNFFRSMGIPCWHMIKAQLLNKGRIQPLDFHPHWHWQKPLPGAEPFIFPLPILDPVLRQRRRAAEVDRRAHARAHNRLRVAQTGRILSQFEQTDIQLRHCTACIIYDHDKVTCRGCRSTGHTRSNCPNVPHERRIPVATLIPSQQIQTQ